MQTRMNEALRSRGALAALALVAALAGLPASHAVAQGGIGGTGIEGGDADPESSRLLAEGGIGGTGITDTGIVGVITARGSIVVNGIRVAIGPQTEIVAAGRPASVDDLAVGNLVFVETMAGESGLRARRVALMPAVVGPLGEMHAPQRRFAVLGQRVRVPEALWRSLPMSFKPGDTLKVSGLRQVDGEIVASRVEAQAGVEEFSVLGPVTDLGRGTLHVYDLTINVSGVPGGVVDIGRQVQVRGTLEDGALRANEVSVLPAIPFDGALPRVVLEGLVQARAEDRLRVGGVEVELPADVRYAPEAPAAIALHRRVIITARVIEGRRLEAERVELLPQVAENLPAAVDSFETRPDAEPDRGR